MVFAEEVVSREVLTGQVSSKGASVTVVADACAGVDDTSHAQTLAIMALYGPLVRVASLADGLALAAGPP